MIAAGTLARYISWRFILAISGVLLLCVVLVFLVDFVELLRRSGKYGSVPTSMLAWLAILRLPSSIEVVLPMTVLAGSMGAFLLLSRSSELIIARAAGISAWQFMLPGIAVAVLIGVVSITVYNPLAAYARSTSESLYADLFGRQGSISILKTANAGAWLRQDGVDGQSVIHAGFATNNGLSLARVTALHFDREGNLFERLEAETAELKDGRWELKSVWVSAFGREPAYHADYILSTYLTPTQVRTALGSTSSISFWDLPGFIDLAEKAGLPAIKYKIKYQLMLARPLLLTVMVLLAATCTLRAFRFGKIQTMVVAGMFAGFAFFLLGEVSRKFGLSGLAAPEVAAWAPSAIVACLSLTFLLYQEDG